MDAHSGPFGSSSSLPLIEFRSLGRLGNRSGTAGVDRPFQQVELLGLAGFFVVHSSRWSGHQFDSGGYGDSARCGFQSGNRPAGGGSLPSYWSDEAGQSHSIGLRWHGRRADLRDWATQGTTHEEHLARTRGKWEEEREEGEWTHHVKYAEGGLDLLCAKFGKSTQWSRCGDCRAGGEGN